MIRPAQATDTHALVALAIATGLFSREEADLLLRQTLDDLHAGRLGDDHVAFVVLAEAGSEPLGWAYASFNAKTNGVWDLWWIGVAPECHGRGLGTELLAFVEQHVRRAGARVLVIETSALPALAETRSFYRRRGYVDCGTVPDFYGDGDGKVTFAKHVADNAEPMDTVSSRRSGIPQ